MPVPTTADSCSGLARQHREDPPEQVIADEVRVDVLFDGQTV